MKMVFKTLTMVLLTLSVWAQESDLPAFPGAEGFGKYTSGGRGGSVIYVTTLDDNSNPGSLRYAINQSGARIVLFKVSGTIKLKSSLKIKNANITIAGQTAPGDGITLRDYPVTVDADNVIIRFLRFRMGDVTNQEADALGGRYHKNIIIDHCSLSWSTDECVSFYGNENFTLQWSIASESLRNSVHDKGKHGYGGIWGGEKASFHHNLLAHHDSRNPRFCGSRYSGRPEDELVDYRNNVIYNWGGNGAYAAEGGSYNMVNNYYKPGPATSSSKYGRIIEPYADNGENSQPKGIYGHFFVEGNFMTKSTTVTNDNWAGVNMHSSFGNYAPGVTKDDLRANLQFPSAEVTTHSAEIAYERILDFCGASLATDSVDLRILKDVSTGTATYMDGGNGSKNGLVDTQDAVGGWPVFESMDAPADSDNDGMPDDWETANNLNPDDPGDAQLKSVDGLYPNVEVYINSIVNHIISEQNKDGISTAVEKIDLDKNKIKLYFNTSSKELIVKHDHPVKNIAVFNISGKMVLQQSFNSSNINTSMANLKNGIYIVRITDYQNQVFAEKVPVF